MALSKTYNLEGPDKYHVFIGHREEDSALAADIKEILEKRNIFSYGNNDDQSKSDRFNAGIAKSRKVLLLLTSASSTGNDPWFNYQVKGAIEKAKARCMECLVIVLKDVEFPNISDKLRTDLQGFHSIKYSEKEFQDKLVDILGTEALPDPKMVPKSQIGFSLACSYFHNYLTFVLPGLAQRIKESQTMEINGEVIMSYKMFIIIPASCKCPAELSEYDGAVSSYASLPYSVSYGGISGRDYKANVNRILFKKKEYRAVIECATPLTALYNMAECQDSSGMSVEDCEREMKQFYFHLRAWLSKHDLLSRARLVYYEDVSSGMGVCHSYGSVVLRESNGSGDYLTGGNQPFVELLIKAIEEEINEESGKPIPQAQHLKEVREVKAHHLRAIKEHQTVPHYDLECCEGQKRGRCYIFNNEFFSQTSGLSVREGAKKDMDCVTELFEKMKFQIVPFCDVTAPQMKDQFALMAVEDFSEDSAVVVVIMTHGNLGKVFGVDGEGVKITYLTQQLDQNSTLKRKPRMFFIQACQRGSKERKSETRPQSADVTSPTSLGVGVPRAAAFSLSSESSYDENTQTSIEAEEPISVRTGSTENPQADKAGMTNPPQLVERMKSIKVPGTVLEADADPEERTVQADLVPGAPDFLMSYATLPGKLSYRHPTVGSLYIRSLAQFMLQHHCEMALDRILMKVTEQIRKEMARMFPNEEFAERQFPFFLCTTERLIFL